MSDCPHCKQDLEAEEYLEKAQRLAKRRGDEIERLLAALKPFAEFAQMIEREHPGWYHRHFRFTDPQIKMPWLIDARSAYEHPSPSEPAEVTSRRE